MPPTKHKQGDIFFSHGYDVMADVVGWVTGQAIQLLGMMTEAMHNPLLMDRYVALKGADYVYRAWKSMGGELQLRPGGMVERGPAETLGTALAPAGGGGRRRALRRHRQGPLRRRVAARDRRQGARGRGRARPRATSTRSSTILEGR